MKKSNKVLLFFISLAGIAFSLCILSSFYYIPFITNMVDVYEFWLNDVFAGYIAFICLCFFALLLTALFSPGKSGDLIMAKSKGKLIFSKQTIESTVRYSFADVGGIKNSKVRVKINKQPEKTKIYIKLALNDSSKLVGLTETIQDKIESALEMSLGIAVKSINIKVVEVNPENKAQKPQEETGADTAKESRVV